jgi:transcription elongation factor GreA-like protein
MDALESFINSSIGEEYTDFNEEDLSGLGEEEEMDEINVGDYADLDEEAIDETMFDYKPDFVSSELSEEDYDADHEEMEEEIEEEEVEIDLEEIKNEINNNIHTTLSKYFK